MKFKIIFFVFIVVPIVAFAQYSENEWKERDTWMPLELIYNLAEIEEGSHVADIGCHEGYFSIHLSKLVGEDGSVYSVDVRQDRLELLNEHLEERNLGNVKVILGDYDNPKLPKNTLDVVVIMDTYHEMTDYMTILEHVYTSLKPGGRIVIIEKLKSRIIGKSRDSQTDAHSLSTKYVKRELRRSGFKLMHENNDIGDWENDSEKVMWILVAKKPNTH